MPTYRDGIQSAYVGELVGEHLYRALAGLSVDSGRRSKLNAIAEVERLTHHRLQPIADRLQIEPAREQWQAVVERRTREIAPLTWPEFIAQALEKWPPYIARFEELALLAPPSDAGPLELLVEHEVALVRFARAENDAEGADVSLGILEAFLAGRGCRSQGVANG